MRSFGWGQAAEVRRAEGLLGEAVAARGDGPAVLCHGELFPGHIFVATGEDAAVTVTGLIDFGDACYAPSPPTAAA